MPQDLLLLDNLETCVDAIIARVGKRLRVAAPLGLGKPHPLLNALYGRAQRDSSLDLHILTALTLERPRPQGELEARLVGPLVERIFGDFPDPLYERDRMEGRLPPNVRVLEFYFMTGKYMQHPDIQREYISTNYTFAARDLMDRGANVIVQQVCWGDHEGRRRLSLSCNADTTGDLVAAFAASERRTVCVAQINAELPFMHGEAMVEPSYFDIVVDSPAHYHKLFGTPKDAVSDADYAIGLYASTLIKDGGELQIGIGSLGDALVYALLLRHQHNDIYLDALDRLRVRERFGRTIDLLGGTAPFEEGLFACTEMFVDGFMHLIDAGIVKRRVYDDVDLQRLLNAGTIEEEVTPATLVALHLAGAIESPLRGSDVEFLRRWGILRPDVYLDASGKLVTPDGERLSCHIDDDIQRAALAKHALGDELRGGRVVHAGFLLGPEGFYQWLRDLPEERRRLIDMRSVSRVNQLYGHEQLDRLHRRDARFVNSAMIMTLSGAAASDGLEDGRVVSGVGGQYNFVAMAHALPDGHSILQVRATRSVDGEPISNLRIRYGHTTIPRHLRDVAITEYGIAYLRGKTDEEVARAMLAIADARCVEPLIDEALEAGKVSPEYELPGEARENVPDTYGAVFSALRARGFFPAFPFGTDLTHEEITLAKALGALQSELKGAASAAKCARDAWLHGGTGDDVKPYLVRMGLWDARTLSERAYRRLVAAQIRKLL